MNSYKKAFIAVAVFLFSAAAISATEQKVTSPDEKLSVCISDTDGKLTYSVSLGSKEILLASRLGLTTNFADFTKALNIASVKTYTVSKSYDMSHTKRAHSDFKANAADISVTTSDGHRMTVTFVVADNDIAYRYTLPRQKDDNPKAAVVLSEASSYRFPDNTTTFLSPQSTPMIGWERTKPSYEEEYKADAPMTDRSLYGAGYTYPCLFHISSDAWALVSETGVDGQYAGTRLSDFTSENGYTVSYPQQGENNGFGSASAAMALPGSTPWRTVTIGSSLKPVVETTIPFDLVEPKYEANAHYAGGRYTWSWLIWQDNSINYDDQVRFIDLAAEFGYEKVLVDGWWDTRIGHRRMEQLAEYAKSKNVSLMLWYNSNGAENDAPQGPRNIMNNAIARKKEMAWLKKIGVSGIKVDFFGGDKQETMRLYEDILSDANDFGIGVIFHGCTLPRGWERMYPNYIGSEAALASENIFFTEHHARREGFEMCMHPFARNTAGSFDWGGIIMNDYLSKDNRSRHKRYTSRLFELATAITNQVSVCCVEVTPQAVETLNATEKEMLRHVPSEWSDTRFIDGYPTRYAVIARRELSSGRWLVGGINGTDKTIQTTLSLDMLAGKNVILYYENKNRQTLKKEIKISSKGLLKVELPAMGGLVIAENK